MSTSERQMRLGAFIMATGHHIAAWRHPEAQADAGLNIDHYRELAQTAERGKFDLVFVADSPAGWDRAKDPEALRRTAQGAHFEPLTLWAALSQVTKHIGFVATASTTYEDPYLLARRFASLDYISKGRAAWNVVTTGADVSKNFSIAGHPAHADRYERAEEFVDLVKGLWDSYEDDAFIRDKESGVYLDPDKVHLVDHKGKFFSVAGPLNVGRPVQGYPVIVQAGASEPGRELAARTAEMIFTANQTFEDAQEFYSDVKGRLARYGRRPDELLISPGIFPVLGGTEAEAQANYDHIQSLVHPSIAWNILARHYKGVDLSGYSLDDPAPPLPENTELNKSRLKLVSDLVSRNNLTLRQFYLAVATARGHRTVVGTPEQIADAMQSWFENGAADACNIMPPILPTALTDFVDQVVPILRKRGLFRHEYEGTTLRENLGLQRPPNGFVVQAGQQQKVQAAV
ncbi:LLM class flavin-dependent oxidoreductase [Rhizobium indigoferae]|uniref:LLM class flavin-dependent oxidoreductase n=1 Tax=Rhizobium indigoferae TaxID=158891 RepID=A0ABZ1DNI6_9HYPH|nr:LLM class flavin-dependent oxidoreductase [Rhizobium indigoferae]NNU56883.1 LLM class flavin-dependent oxidoreductase [Rhizobium indigoferae]WRW37783.1 LLM class flavin-dependent oxidoreductase [Rhizobium indigoferae]GLR62113.1 monooxygenase [Rhizobium indigoferae]